MLDRATSTDERPLGGLGVVTARTPRRLLATSLAWLIAVGFVAIGGAERVAAVNPTDGVACTRNWKIPGTGDISWANPGNWVEGLVPGAQDVVCVGSNAGDIELKTDGLPGASVPLQASVKSIYADTGSSVVIIDSDLTISDSTKPSVISNLVLANFYGGLHGAASIVIPSGGSFAWPVPATFDGSGSLTIEAGATGAINVDLPASYLYRPIINNGTLTIKALPTTNIHQGFLSFMGPSGSSPGGSINSPGNLILDATLGDVYADWSISGPGAVSTGPNTIGLVTGSHVAQLGVSAALGGTWTVDPLSTLRIKPRTTTVTISGSFATGDGSTVTFWGDSNGYVGDITGSLSGPGRLCVGTSVVRLLGADALAALDQLDTALCSPPGLPDQGTTGGGGVVEVPQSDAQHPNVQHVHRLIPGGQLRGGGTLVVTGDGNPTTPDAILAGTQGHLDLLDATLQIGPEATAANDGGLGGVMRNPGPGGVSRLRNFGEFNWGTNVITAEPGSEFVNELGGTVVVNALPDTGRGPTSSYTERGLFIQNGTMRINSGTFRLAGGQTFAGLTEVKDGAELRASPIVTGTLQVDGATSASPGGTVRSQDDNFTNSGIVSLGVGAQLNTPWDYTQSSSGTLHIDIAGSSDAEHGIVSADRAVRLAGQLTVSAVQPIADPPAAIDVVRGPLDGHHFDTFTPTGPVGATWADVYSSTAASVSVSGADGPNTPPDPGRVLQIVPSTVEALAAGPAVDVSLVLTDSAGHPVAGTTLTLASSGATRVSPAAGAVTDAQGIAHFTITDAYAERAQLSSPGFAATASVLWGTIPTIDMPTQPTGIAGVPLSIPVTINGLSSPVVSVTGIGATPLPDATGLSWNGFGLEGILAPTIAGRYGIRITATNQFGSAHLDTDIVIGADFSRYYSVRPSVAAALAGGPAIDVAIHVQDGFNNPVEGTRVLLDSTGSSIVTKTDGSIRGTGVFTDAAGDAHFLISDPVAEVVTLTRFPGPETSTIAFVDPLTMPNQHLAPSLVDVDYFQQLVAAGGDGNYVWTSYGDPMPDGLTLSTDGIVAGTPTTVGSFVINVMVSDGAFGHVSRAMSVFISDPLSVQTGALPDATIGQPYSESLVATGGGATYTWTLAPGEHLPSGLTLAANGNVTGTPTIIGTTSFIVIATDVVGNTGSAKISLRVDAPLTMPDQHLKIAVTDQLYSDSLYATGGTGTYTWRLITGETLPAGLTLAPNGHIEGQPTGPSRTYAFQIELNDGRALPIHRTMAIFVADPLAMTISLLPPALTGQSYSLQLTGTGGAAPLVWTVAPGTAMPAGLSLSSDGWITGTPTAVGHWQISVVLSDGILPDATGHLDLLVTSPLALISGIMPAGMVGVPYSLQLIATGGDGRYVFRLATGAILPSGLTLAPDGRITGTPTAAGSRAFTVVVSDGAFGLRQGTMLVPISPASADMVMTLTAGTFATGQTGQLTMMVRNVGSRAAATPLVVTNLLPGGLINVSVAAPPGWTCNVFGRLVTCTSYRSLAPGASAALIITARTLSAPRTRLTDSAAVVAAAIDPTPANNVATLSITVQ